MASRRKTPAIAPAITRSPENEDLNAMLAKAVAKGMQKAVVVQSVLWVTPIITETQDHTAMIAHRRVMNNDANFPLRIP